MIVSLSGAAKEEMRNRHEGQQKAAMQKVEKEVRAEEQRKKEAWEQEREKLLHEKRNKQAAEIASRPDLSGDELAAVSLI